MVRFFGHDDAHQIRENLRMFYCALRPLVFLLVLFIPGRALAQGGPPMLTDDPDTPGPGYWEINFSSILEGFHSVSNLQAPYADINYGAGKRIQLKFEIPFSTVRQAGQSTQNGQGDSIAGVKWRFLGSEAKRLAWSTYPQVEIPTGSWTARRGIPNEGWQLLLPTEFTIRLRNIELNGEVGRNFAQKGGNGWIFGLLTEVEIKRFELLEEEHAEQQGPGPAEFTLNIGSRVKLTEKLKLLLAVGRDLHGPPEDRMLRRVYLGLQFNLPHQYVFN